MAKLIPELFVTNITNNSDITFNAGGNNLSFSDNLVVNNAKNISLFNSGNANRVTVSSSSSMINNVNFTLPATEGSTNQVLSNTGGGITSWVDRNPFNQSLNTTDNATFNNVTVNGNLNVNGSAANLNVNTLSVNDPILEISSNNVADTNDIGIYGSYFSGGTRYSGIIRDASDSGIWKIFTNTSTVPNNTFNYDSSLGSLQISNLQLGNSGFRVNLNAPTLSNSYSLTFPGTLPASNSQALTSTVSGVSGWSTVALQGGNSLGSSLILGTNDANDLVFETNNSTALTINSSGNTVLATGKTLTISGSTSGNVTLNVPAISGSNTLTLPAATDTLVARNTIETLSNKTLNATSFSGSTTFNGAASGPPNITIGSSNGVANRFTIGETFPPPNDVNTVISVGSVSSAVNCLFAISKTGVNTGFISENSTGMVISQTLGSISFRNGLSYNSNNVIESGTLLSTLDTNGLVLETGAGGRLLLRNASGTVTFQPSLSTTSWSLTLPTGAGSSGQVLTTDGSGLTSWSTVLVNGTISGPVNLTSTTTLNLQSTNALLSLASGTGNVSLTSNGNALTYNGTVLSPSDNLVSLGGVSNKFLDVWSRTLRLNGSASGSLTLQTPSTFSSWNLTFPTGPGSSGQVLTTDGSGLTSWSTALVNGTISGPVNLNSTTTLNLQSTNDLLSLASGTGNISFTSVGTTLVYNGGTLSPATDISLSLGTITNKYLNVWSRFLRVTGSTSGIVTIQGQAAAGTWNLSLPTGPGSSGQVLTTDGSGVTSWSTALVSGTITGPVNITSTTTLNLQSTNDLLSIVSGTGNISLTSNSNSLVYNGTAISPADAVVSLGGASNRFLDVYSRTSRLYGSVSGSLILQTPSTFTSWSLTFPSSTGSSGQVLTTDGSGVTSWSTALVSGTITGPVNITSTTTLNLQSTNDLLSIVSGTGNITLTSNSNTLTYNGTSISPADAVVSLGGASNKFLDVWSRTLRLNGSASGSLTLQTPSTFTNWTLTFPSNAGSSGQVLATNGSGVTSWSTALVSGTITGPVNVTSTTTLNLQSTNDLLSIVSGTGNISLTSNGNALTYNGSVISPADVSVSLGGASNKFLDVYSRTSRLYGSTSGNLTLQTPASFTSWSLTFPSSSGSSGQVLTTNGSGVTSWTTALVNGTITGPVNLTSTTSLNIQSTNDLLSIASGTGNISLTSNGNALTYNGSVISPADVSVSLGGASNKFLDVYSRTSRLAGSTSGILALQVPSTFSSWNLTFPSSAGSSGQVLTTNGSGVTSWTTALVNGTIAGPVNLTSTTTLNLQSTNDLLSIASGTGNISLTSNSNTLTYNGTSISPADAVVNLGGASNRFLDVWSRTLKLNGSTSGVVTVQTAAAAGTWSLTLPTTSGTSGQVLGTDGTGVTDWTTSVLAGGNSLGGTLTIGTNDAQSLILETNNAPAITINSSGNTTFAAGKTLALSGSTSGTVSLTVPAISGSSTLTLPAATDTLVGRNTVDTLTNKTLQNSAISGSDISDSQFLGTSTFNSTGSPNIVIGTSNSVANRLTINETVFSTSDTGTVLSVGSGNASRNILLTLSKSSVGTGVIGEDGANLVLGQQTGGGIIFRNVNYANTDVLNGTTLATLNTSGLALETGIGSRLLFRNASGTVTVQPASGTGTWQLTLPTGAGGSGEVLSTNGSGVTSWKTVIPYENYFSNTVTIQNNVNITGINNSIYGSNVGGSLTTGNNNTLSGTSVYNALQTGSNNTSFGYNITSGTATATSAAFGSSLTLATNSYNFGHNNNLGSGNNNSCFGRNIGNALFTGEFNTILVNSTGSFANATSASGNTVIGNGSFANITTGIHNIGIGYNMNNTLSSGSGNVSLGVFAANVLSSGNNNIAIGVSACSSGLETQSNNIYIGANSAPLSSSVNNVIALGSNLNISISDLTYIGQSGQTGVVPYTDNALTLGNNTFRWLEVHTVNGVITTSDAREKKDVESINSGLEFIKDLRPVEYSWKDSNISKGKRNLGFIAQEIPNEIAEKYNLVETGDRYGVRYSELIAPLVKAVQELSEKIKKLEAQLNN